MQNMYLLYFYNNVKKEGKRRVTSNLSGITFFVQTFLINFLFKNSATKKASLESSHYE